MSKIKVSIIIPVYNAEKHLKQCLNSLISQTINEIEVICVDDCSTDNSQNIIEDFNTKDDRIRYFSMRKNSGSGLARNKGINHAKGEYLSFVDADDHIINTNCYEEIYKFAHKNSADMVSTNLKLFTNDGKYFQNKQCFEIASPFASSSSSCIRTFQNKGTPTNLILHCREQSSASLTPLNIQHEPS